MTNRNREIDTLFQRMEATRSGAPDSAVEEDAAHAVEQWPLLAMLTLGHRAAPHRPQPVPAADRPVQPATQPTPGAMDDPAVAVTLRAPVAEAPMVDTSAVDSPIADLVPPVPPAPPPAPPASHLSPLEQLFLRAGQIGKNVAAQPALAAPEPAVASAPRPAVTVAPQSRSFAPLGPPPLKVPGQNRPAALTPSSAVPPAAGEETMTIEPKPREWRELDTVPARLFERVGAR